MNFLKKLTILFVFQLNSSIGSSQGLNKDLNSKLHTPIYVLTTFSILEDFVKNIGGSDVVVQSLIGPGQDPHNFEPKPLTQKILRQSDLIFANGLYFEDWLIKWLDSSKVKIPVYYLSQGVKEEKTEKNLIDPHAWQDPLNVLIYCENIKNALCIKSPERCTNFKSRLDAYKSKILGLHHQIESTLSLIPKNQRNLAVSHNFLRYFAKRYDLNIFGIFKTDSPTHLTAQEMRRAIDTITEHKIKIIFSEFSSESNQVALQIAHETHSSLQGNLFSDSLSDSEGPGSHYISMMESNLNKISTAFKSK